MIFKLKDLVNRDKKIRYGIVQPGQFDENGNFLIRGKDYSKGWANQEELFKVSPLIEKRYLKARVNTGDILITIVGANTGYTEIVPAIFDNANITQTTARISIDNKKAEPLYIKYFLESPIGKKEIDIRIKGQAQPGLNVGDVEKIPISLPSSKIQKSISQHLLKVDQKVNLLTKKKEALETYKKGLMQKIFSQELRFKREDGTDYPEWDCQPLGDLAYITSGKSNREDSDTDAKYHFFDRSSDVRRSGIYLFDDDAVIVAGEGQEFIPKKYSGKFDLHQRAYAIMKFGNRLSYEYCYYFIFHHRRYFEKMAVGTTVLSLRLPMFQKMQIQLPSIDEQAKIASVFENLDSYLQKVSYSIQSTELLKRGLLQQMFV